MICASWGLAREIGFLDDFSLAGDRNEALKLLIPGTEDFYYYSSLQAQNIGKFDDVQSTLALWIKRYGYTPRVKEIQNRQALLDYEKDPRKSLDYIRRELGLTFDHRRVIADQKTDFPSRLDPTLIGFDTLMKGAFVRYQNLQGIENAGLDRLPAATLDPIRRRDWLTRLPRPDMPGLPQLVADDLRYEHSGGFGSLPIHANLLLDQLQECARLMPELMDNTKYVDAVIRKLAPGDDVDLRSDLKEKRAFIERLVTFTRPLAPAFNSLKAQSLYQLLDFNRKEGNYDPALFMEYIQLPRNVGYINPQYANLGENRNVMADLRVNLQAVIRFPPVPSDEELVRDYLARFFLTAPDHKAYAKFIRDDFLVAVFAEAKIVNGVGDMEKWYSLMTPAAYQALKERVDLDFAVSNRVFFAADEPVTLDVHVKNAGTLIVKVFEINAFNYYRSKQEEINTALDLDGLIATDERVVKTDSPPLRRVLRPFPLPQCAKPGVYVVEFIGNGRSSRALIRKGLLHVVEKIGPAGHEFTILDEANRRRPAATIWLGAREYRADDKGLILVPFSTEPGPVTMILKDGDLCSLATFRHRSEEYALKAGFYVDREALLKGSKAQLVVRPVLTLNGYPISLSLLDSLKLSIQSADLQGISTLKEIPDFKLAEDRESTCDFQVPENLARISFRLTAKVRNVSRQKDDELADDEAFMLNGIDATPAVEELVVRHVDTGYCIDLLGKNGEAKAARPVHVELKHRAFRDTVHVPLQTDAGGRIELGSLPGIEWVKAQGPDSHELLWRPGEDEASCPANLHGMVGGTVKLPFFPTESDPRLEYSLLEKRGNTYYTNRIEAVRFKSGFLEVSGLPAGDYELYLKRRNESVTIRLTGGALEAGGAVSRARTLEILNPDPMQISGIQVTNETLTITLANATAFSRLHVLATRFMPANWVKGKLDYDYPEPYSLRRVPPESLYVAGRDIGDEYRYVLDRKYAEKFPGNMLARASLLLSPWSISKTETAEQEALAGEAMARYAGRGSGLSAQGAAGKLKAQPTGDYANLDFLRDPATVLLNLKPDAKGVVTVDRKTLGNHSYLRLVAVDPFTVVCRHLALPDVPLALRDLRLPVAMDPQKHFTEQKVVTVIPTNGVLELKDITTSEFNLYDSLDKVYNLLSTLSGNPTLADFRFILRWPELAPKEKQDNFSKYACHELSFFLYHKDRAFFDSVVLPFLKNKKDKTFMDQWLIGGDLSAWTQPWAFSQLNIVEQALLARRGIAPADRMARYVKDLADMIPPDPDDYNRRFDTGIRTAVLETGDQFGFEVAKEDAWEKKQLVMNMVVEAEAPAPAMAPAAPMVMAGKAFAAKDEAAAADRLVLADAKSPSPPGVVRATSRAAAEQQGLQEGESAKRKAGYFDARQDKRREITQLFRKLDKTEEWVENNYYHLPIEEQNAGLVTANPFWNDYAQHDGKKPFLSRNIFYADRSFTEIMLALAVLDVPFKAATHKTDIQGPVFTLKAGNPLIAFHQEIKEGATAADKTPILVSQNYYRADDRYRFVGNERFDKFVTEEFLVQTAYGCQVVLVNPTSSRQTLRLLLQIPKGALAVQNGFYTRGIPVTLEPYATRTLDYFFYFPASGQAVHYPVQVAKDEQYVASAPPVTLNVVNKLSKIDTESWDYVSQNDTPEGVLTYLQANNINRIELAKIAWRMKEKVFFEKVLALLQERHVYHDTLWSYGILHDVIGAAREFLKRSDFANRCGAFIETPLLSIDPVERKTYQHMEYKPLVNARIHSLGKKRQILNDRFYDQYQRFLTVLSYRPKLDQDDLLGVTYYLLLQDRVGEALRFFKRVDPARLQTKMQYDYLDLYMAFNLNEVPRARAIADRYKDYPVPRWRDMFADARSQLDELEGKAAAVTDADDRQQAQTKAVATEPAFDFKVEARQVSINYQNLTACRINYYPMDIELLFSRNPFVKQQTDQFAFVRPADTQEVALPAGKASLTIDIPKKFSSSNVMVEIVAGGLRDVAAYYANTLVVKVSESYGQVQVLSETTGKPLPTVYVKAYARMKDGTVRFYRDGYTDLRGRFDYASLNTNEIEDVDRLSLLILSDSAGAVIREAAPPKK
jgi:hypothetical protein